jgi:hypothetical protein
MNLNESACKRPARGDKTFETAHPRNGAFRDSVGSW